MLEKTHWMVRTCAWDMCANWEDLLLHAERSNESEAVGTGRTNGKSEEQMGNPHCCVQGYGSRPTMISFARADIKFAEDWGAASFAKFESES
jgi:hypothetical protein